MYTDSHCHLDFACFDDILDSLLLDCAQSDVNSFIVPSTTAASWSKVVALPHRYQQISIALGLHPYFLEQYEDSHLSLLEQILLNTSVVAVGEIGLDKWPNMPAYRLQEHVFIAQLELAQSHRLPVILHARKSEDDLLKYIRQLRFTQGGIVHAFNGSLQQAQQFVELGFVIGVGGTVTYPRAKKAHRVLRALDDSDYVLETDSPDMPLKGFQGLVNTPKNIPLVAECVASLRDQSLEQIAHDTRVNLQRVLPNWHEVEVD
ncbi:TatD family deoxyribonuclease [Marinomonas piezotolerans]|uniref:TatD family deoxyribonuclease n=1 Tax=Marinomonas piezotolerans TaxID=2213058 RepID=A0A370U7K3_9GAMM|nr:TatD family hydrolase [Marinomonas piezotolerans]RDL43733.1 TatD family deoxyribonuclease [Marinomonas piezotolerans]